MTNQLSFGGSTTTINRFVFLGVFSLATTYQPFACVFDPPSGASYVALTTTLGNAVSNATFWAQMTGASGVSSVAGRTGAVVLSSVDLTDKDAVNGVAGLDASAFLKAAEFNITVNAQVGTTYTVVAGDRGKLLTLSNAASIAVTLPQATGSFAAGWFAEVENIGAGVVTITPTTSTIDGAASLTLSQFQSVTLTSVGGNYVCLRSKPLLVAADIPTIINSVVINPSATGTGAALTVGGTSATTGGVSIFVGASGAQNERLSVIPADGSSAATRVGSLSVRTAAAGFLTGAEVAKIDAAGAFTGRGGFVAQTTTGTLPATIANDTAGGVVITNNAGGSIQFGNGGTLFLNQPQGIRWTGATSGNTVVQAAAIAGAGTLTLPGGVTDTLVGKATTDILSSKTLTGAGSGNTVTLLNAQGVTGTLTGNAADQTVYTFTILPNTVGAGKGIRVTLCWLKTGGTAVVTYKLKLGATTLEAPAYSTTSTAIFDYYTYTVVNASGVQNSQNDTRLGIANANGVVAPSASFFTSAVDFSTSLALTLTFNVAATDTIVGKSFLVELVQ